MEPASSEFAEIDSCFSLFLREIAEPSENALRLLIEEAFILPQESAVAVEGTEIRAQGAIRSIEGSRLFELVWDSYVAYSVRNESYVSRDQSEGFLGRIARIYSKSYFLEYISHSTFACNQHPGPLKHVGLVSESHIIDVVSTEVPRVRQTRLRPALQ